MKPRYEYKYLVPIELIDDIRAEISLYMELDNFAKKHNNAQYTVRSIYYDTPKFTCYTEKLAGLPNRNKYRIRGYDKQDNKSIAFLEIKKKITNCISKSRAPLYYRNIAKSLSKNKLDKYIIPLNGNANELEDGQKFLYHYQKKNLQPAVLIIYEREAFVGKFDSSLRITLDKNLRSSIFPSIHELYLEKNVKKIMNKNFVLEVKFYGTLPKWLKILISKYELRKQAISKYTLSLEVHHKFNNRKFVLSNIISNREVYCA